MGTASSPGPGSADLSSCDEHDDTSVRVALRARPLVTRERLEGAKACVAVDEASGTVVFGSQRRFAFDHVFGPHSTQDQVYETCVSDLVDAVVEGYNATVLAYGPTGSGKTYTMGTGSALYCVPEQQGIIPRVIRRLFEVIQSSSNERSFVVRAQFLEIYNEELRDLLAPPGSYPSSSVGSAPFSSTSTSAFSSSKIDNSCGAYATSGAPRGSIVIRECPDGQIVVTGAREEIANSCEDLAHLLDSGALARATGATALNEQSSRSHAIFTIIVEQSIRARSEQHAGQPAKDSIATQRPASRNSCSSPLTPRARLLQHLNHSTSGVGPFRDSADVSYTHGRSRTPSSTSSSKEVPADGFWDVDCSTDGSLQMEYRCAKFHLVDLAGSERTKRSGAVGARFKETVTINQGLLALGNVISALGDDKRRLPGRHVPYRDSKLTRLLQDSLGGNSKTLMIACISSADDVLEENLNTLKYASRARHIRNRPVVNCQKLGSGTGGVAGDVQALQLLLLRRFTHQVLGPLTSCAVPEQLLADVSRCGEAASVRLLRELKVLAAVPKAALTAGLSHDIQLRDQEHQHHSQQLNSLQQQVSDLESLLVTARMQAAAFEMQLDIAAQEKAAAQQAVAEVVQQQNTAQEELLLQIEQLQETGRIGPAVRSQLSQLVLKLLKPYDKCQQMSNPATVAAKQALRGSVLSHPLPILDTSCCDDTLLDAIRATKAGHAGTQRSCCGGLHTEPSRQVDQLKQQLAEATSELQAAQQDLAHDEDIFAQRVMEMAKLRDDMAVMASAAQQDRAAAAAQIQHLQTDLRRWRTRALALQGCATVDVAAAGGPQVSHAAAAMPGRTNPDGQQPCCPDSLVGELSFAGFARQHLPASPQQQAAPLSTVLSEATNGSNSNQGVAGTAEADVFNRSNDVGPASMSGTKTRSGLHHDHDLIEDDQVLFDDDLASYISDTDYTDLRSEDSHHLMAELQAVLADKAALEDEKAMAQAEAAAARQSFERSRALLESQLAQLSSAIGSQETLISTLQSNEAEARQLGALYLDRCRELEAELAELQLDLEELTSALAQVEADAAASAEEKQRQRAEYEQKISTVVEQMSGLQRQLKGQEVSRVERERQRAAHQVQQLQSSLASMRAEQEALRKRLQERLLAQEKAAADKAKELAALRRAADVAKKRVLELEQQNKRQQAELRAKTFDAARAQKQLKALETQASLARSKPCFGSPRMSPKASPGATPRATSSAQAPRSLTKSSSGWPSSDTATAATHRDSASSMIDRTKSGSIFKHGVGGRKAPRQPSPVVAVAGNAVAKDRIARQDSGEPICAADLSHSPIKEIQQQQWQRDRVSIEDPDCVQLRLPGACVDGHRGSHSAAVQPATVGCSGTEDTLRISTQLQQLGPAATVAVSSRSHRVSFMQHPSSMRYAANSAAQVSDSGRQLSTLADAVAASSSIISSIASLTGTSKIRSWLKSQLQLLAVKQNAELELQQLQERYEAAVQQRNQLLAATAVLDIQQMRKDSAAAAVKGNCSSSGSSSRLGRTWEPSAMQQHDTGLSLGLGTATVMPNLPEGLRDQLDAAGAQLEHLTHQMQQQQAQFAAADEATAHLRAQVPHMSVKELGILLEQAMDLLVEQTSLCQTVAAKATGLELDLQQQQQQLEEAASRLHSTQLQHQVHVTLLQHQHEQRLMQLLRQPAAATGAGKSAAGGAGEAAVVSGGAGGVQVTDLQQHHELRLTELPRQSATAAGGGARAAAEVSGGVQGVLVTDMQQEHEQRLVELTRQSAAAATGAAGGGAGEAVQASGSVGGVLVADLQEECEQRLKELLRQSATAAEGGGEEISNDIEGLLQQQCKQPGNDSSCNTSAPGERMQPQPDAGSATAAAVAMLLAETGRTSGLQHCKGMDQQHSIVSEPADPAAAAADTAGTCVAAANNVNAAASVAYMASNRGSRTTTGSAQHAAATSNDIQPPAAAPRLRPPVNLQQSNPADESTAVGYSSGLREVCMSVDTSGYPASAATAAECTEAFVPAHVQKLQQQQQQQTLASAAPGPSSTDESQAPRCDSTEEPPAMRRPTVQGAPNYAAARRSSTNDSQAPAAAAVEGQEPVQRRLSHRQGSPTKGPQLSDLMACLAQRPNSRQQQQVLGPGNSHQLATSQYMQLIGWQGALQQEAGGPGSSDSLSSSSVFSMLGSSGSFSQGQQQQQQQGSPTSSADSSPSKAQAKLAAYRRHLKQASCNTSTQKLIAAHTSTSSPVSITQSGSGRAILHNSPTHLQQLQLQQQGNGDDDGTASSSSLSGFRDNRSSSKRQSGELRALASYAKSALSQQHSVHDQTDINRPVSSASKSGKGLAVQALNPRVEGSSSLVSSTQTGAMSSSPVSKSLVSKSLVSNSWMIRADKKVADSSIKGLHYSDISSSRAFKDHNSPLRVDRDSPSHAAALVDSVDGRAGGWDTGKYGSLDSSPAKLVAAAAALLRDAGLDPDADDHDSDQL